METVSDRLTDVVREQLLAMSPATIDRMLRLTKNARYPAAKSAPRPGATLSFSTGVRQAMEEMEKTPELFEIDLVTHSGHTLKGKHAWILTATDGFTGRTENITIRTRAHGRVVAAIEEIATGLPYPMLAPTASTGSSKTPSVSGAGTATRTSTDGAY